MKDKLHALLIRAEAMLNHPTCARLLVSWDHLHDDFVLHNLTDTKATANYFSDWHLDPLCFIVASHIRLLNDPGILEILARGWFQIIQELSMPPCKTAITLPLPPTQTQDES